MAQRRAEVRVDPEVGRCRPWSSSRFLRAKRAWMPSTPKPGRHVLDVLDQVDLRVLGHQPASARSLRPVGGVAEQEVAHLRLGRAAQQHAEHAAGVGLERVGRARPAVAEVVERPRSDERLGVALLLHPADRRGRLVGEPERGLDGLHLGVGLRLHEERAPLAVALEHLDVLERALPLGRVVDVRRDLVTALHRSVDLDGALTADRSHAGEPILLCAWNRTPSRSACSGA